MNWELKSIGSLCTKITSGGTPSRSNPSFYQNGTVPWIKTGELKGWYIFDAKEHITPEAIRLSSAKIFPPETVLMAMYGQGNTITNVAILGGNAATNQASCAMIVDHEVCHPHFLLYSLKYYKQQLLNLALGASQRNLSVTTISNFQIPCPPLAIQSRIAKILSAYDDLIENNTQRIKALEQAAHDLYREWFVEFRYPGHESVPLVDSDTEYGMIPQGWKLGQIGDLGDVITGKTPSKKDPDNFGKYMPFIKLPDMHQQIFISTTEEELSEKGVATQKNKTIPKNSVCVSCIGTIGIVVITSKPSQTNQQINTIVPFTDSYLEYIYFLLKQIRPIMENFGATGATMANLSKGKFENLSVLHPETEIVVQYHILVQPIFEQILNLVTKNNLLRETRDILLPRLISGELDVNEIELEYGE